MTENGEKKPLLNGSPVCNGVGSNVIDVTGVMSDTNMSLSTNTSITSSGMYRKEEAVQLLNHSDFDESTSRPDDLDDAWLVVSAKNAKKRQENATSDMDTFIHLLKGNIGTGLLALPYAVMKGGVIVGPLGMLFLGVIATHCMVLLVRCANTLCKRNNLSTLDYSETMQFALLGHGFKRMGSIGKWVVNSFLLITQFGFCSVYFVFIADNIGKVAKEAYGIHLHQNVWVVIFIVPVAVVAWIRNLKQLAPFSMIANVCLLTGLAIIFYDMFYRLLTNDNKVAAVRTTQPSLWTEPIGIFIFFANVFYAFEGIGVILPLENKMKKPEHAPYVITLAMFCVLLLFEVFSLMGYLVYGKHIQPTITDNLCVYDTEIARHLAFLLASILFSYATFASYHLQFYVPMDFLEPIVLKKLYELLYRYPHHPTAVKRSRILVRVGFRTAIVIFTAILAIAIPFLDDLMSLIGALASTSLALTFPALIDLLTFWKIKDYTFMRVFPRPVWVIKNLVIIALGLLGFVLGTFAAIWSIAHHYADKENGTDCPYIVAY